MITIFTLNGYSNYGNRLQLFALSKIVAGMVDVPVGVYWKKSIKNKIVEFIKYKTLMSLFYKKESKLMRFTKKYIAKEVNTLDCEYSVIGSDQVWNPAFLVGRPYLLDTPPGRIIISYAASLGVDSLTSDQKKMFKAALSGFNALSVREQSAKQVLRPLTKKRIEVVLDPTLLLDTNEYIKLEKKPNTINKTEKYIFCYILGDCIYRDSIEEYAKNNGLKIILFSDKGDSGYGVEEFLYLINHAELICTDSFHACVFSFIFEKPFVVFRRSGEADYMYSRLQNLIDTFHLRNREFNGKKITKENMCVDYAEGKNILKMEREKSMRFLEKALENKDES